MVTSAKISVIIPVYNAEEHLKECLDSVISQTLKEIEVICVDDGSNDGSCGILYDYASRDSRLMVLKQENQGAGPARNYALSQASGEYICFMDADDYYPNKDALYRLYSVAIKENVEICGGLSCQLCADGNIIPDLLRRKLFPLMFGMYNYSQYQYTHRFQRFIISRRLLLQNGVDFPNYRRFQDPPFLMRALHFAKKVYYIPEVTYIYRVEHKKVEWSLIKACDCIKAINDSMSFALEHRYYDLLDFIVGNLFFHVIDCFGDLCEHPEVSALLRDANALLVFSGIMNRYVGTVSKLSGKNIILYGTGNTGKTVSLYLRDREDICLLGVCNSETTGERTWRCANIELSLYNIAEWKRRAPNAVILVATIERYHDEIRKICESAGFEHIILLDDFLRLESYCYEYCRKTGLTQY